MRVFVLFLNRLLECDIYYSKILFCFSKWGNSTWIFFLKCIGYGTSQY